MASSSVMGVNSISFTRTTSSSAESSGHKLVERGAGGLDHLVDLQSLTHAVVDDASLVLAQLAQHLCGGHVDGGVHVFLVLFHMNGVAPSGEWSLRRCKEPRGFLDTQNDFGLRNVDAQNLHRIADFFNGIVVERVVMVTLRPMTVTSMIYHPFPCALEP